MNEHDNTDPVDPDAAAADQPVAAQPVADAKPRWRDRVFRMRAVAAVAVAGVILGATGGAVTTALIAGDDHGRHDERLRIGHFGPPGMPVVPPDGRMQFPRDGTDDGTDGGTDEPSSLSRS